MTRSLAISIVSFSLLPGCSGGGGTGDTDDDATSGSSASEDSGSGSSTASGEGSSTSTGTSTGSTTTTTTTSGSTSSGETSSGGESGTGESGTDEGGTEGGGDPAPPGYDACAAKVAVSSFGTPPAPDDAGPDDHDSLYGALPAIVPAARGQGSFDLLWQSQEDAEQLIVTHVARDGDGYAARWHLTAPSLGRVAGLDFADGHPVVVTAIEEAISGETEPMGEHRDGIMQVLRFDETCAEAYRVDLRMDFDGDADRLPIYQPMQAGTSRLSVAEGTWVLHYAQMTEYDAGVSSRHQIGRFMVGSAASGALEQEHGDISHSFDQRVVWDGAAFVSLSLGDASLRGIGITKTTAAGDHERRTIFAVKGGNAETGGGYNNTFTRAGQVASSASGYVAIFASEASNTITERVNESRNIALVHVRPDFESVEQQEPYDVVVTDTADGNPAAVDFDVTIEDYWGEPFDGHNRGVVWLTSYADRQTAHAERPKLVALGPDAFVVLWEKWSLDDYLGTFAMVVDEWGRTVVAETEVGMHRLPRGDDAFVLDGGAAWVVGRDGALVLHTVDETAQHTEHVLE